MFSRFSLKGLIVGVVALGAAVFAGNRWMHGAPVGEAQAANALSGGSVSGSVQAAQQIKNDNYTVAVDVGGCKAKSECAVTVKLTALGEFHLNKEYPHKVKVNDAAGVAWAKPEFGKASGDYAAAGEKEATITLKFTPEKAGKVELSGKFKFAVCSESSCSPSSEELKFAADVK
jgi:xylose isomerase